MFEQDNYNKARLMKGQDLQLKILYSDTSGVGTTIGTNVMLENPTMSTDSLRIAILTYASYIYQQNVLGSQFNTDQSVWWQDFSAGLAWLGESIQSISQGATQKTVQIPLIFDVIAQLCSEKMVRIHKSLIRYSPQWETPFSLAQATQLVNGSIYVVVTPPEVSATLVDYSTSTQIAPTEEGYSYLLKAATGVYAFGAQIVEQGLKKGLFTRDPSAFARVYPYFGTGGSAGTGCYSEAELEAPFNYPAFSRFVQYDERDLVISRVFRPTAGGLSTIVGTSLTAHMTYPLLRNPIPVIYKFLDLNQVVMVLCSWMVTLLGQDLYGQSQRIFTGFTFSLSDFVILIRQSVLTMFPSQTHAQFVSPIAGTPTTTQSLFMPLIVDSITTPLPQYANTIIPAFLNENLAMLKQFQVQVPSTPNSERLGTKPKSLCHQVTPVWGVWSGDVLPDYQYQQPSGDFAPLFSATSVLPPCQVWDCKAVSVSDKKTNVNYGLAQIMDEWNGWAVLAKNRSTKQATFASDKNPEVSLLMYTRYLYNSSDSFAASTRPKNAFNAPYYEYIKTLPKTQDLPDKKKSKVQAIVPSTYFSLYTRAILTLNPLPASVITALQLFITPTIRLTTDPQIPDVLSMQAYQVYTTELSSASTSLATIASDNEVARNFIAAENLTSGLFAADANNDIYTDAISEIAKHGGGNDIIKSLLGGLASMIPIVGPALGSVITGM